MNQLRLEAESATTESEELKAKVKELEQVNLTKEQEVTSLSHKNSLLEEEVAKLEATIADFKKAADEGQQHGTQNETLTRRLQLLEEEAEQADKTLRETNEKYVAARRRFRDPSHPSSSPSLPTPTAFFQYAEKYPLSTKGDLFSIVVVCSILLTTCLLFFSFPPPSLTIDSGRLTSRPATSSGKCKHWRTTATNGSKSTRRWTRSTRRCRRSWKTSSSRSTPSKAAARLGERKRSFDVEMAGEENSVHKRKTGKERERGRWHISWVCFRGAVFLYAQPARVAARSLFYTSTNTAFPFFFFCLDHTKRNSKVSALFPISYTSKIVKKIMPLSLRCVSYLFSIETHFAEHS